MISVAGFLSFLLSFFPSFLLFFFSSFLLSFLLSFLSSFLLSFLLSFTRFLFSYSGSVMKSIQPALTSYFFGKEKDQKLTVEKFIHFQKQLQQEILRIEFHRYDLNSDGTLKEVRFGVHSQTLSHISYFPHYF